KPLLGLDATDKSQDETLSELGFLHSPASWSHGGVVVRGGIRRDASVSLAALRLIRAGADEKRTRQLRRYILGLALVALTARPSPQLRQGCLLVADASKPRAIEAVHGDGHREPLTLTHDDALAFARHAAEEFGVGEDREVEFDVKSAKA